jgi:DNA-binding MarR family transcriptional regulator
MDESTVSRNVARMCARGWLHLEPGDDDRRSHQIKITEKEIILLRGELLLFVDAHSRGEARRIMRRDS